MISKLLQKIRQRKNRLNKDKKSLLKKEKVNMCLICDSKLETDIRVLNCGHKFHSDCIDYAENIFYVFSCWKCGRSI